MTPLVFCRFQPPQLLQPSQHICPAGRQQIELNLNSAIGMDDHFVQQISAEQLIVGGCFIICVPPEYFESLWRPGG